MVKKIKSLWFLRDRNLGVSVQSMLVSASLGFIVGASIFMHSPSVQAADQPATAEITLGTHTIRLGTSKNRVLQELSSDLSVQNSGHLLIGGAEFWVVNGTGHPSSSIGNLQFKNDTLVTASRNWDVIELDQRTLTFLKSFHAALEHVFGEGKLGTVACMLDHEPGRDHSQIEFHTGKRSVSFAFSDARLSDNDFFRQAFVVESITK